MKRYYLLIPFMMVLFAFVACDDTGEPGENPSNNPADPAEPPTVEVQTTMRDALIEGTVRDVNGNLLSGVTVTTGSETAVTDNNGNFVFNRVADASGRFVLDFSKTGYFNVTRSGNFEDCITVQVVMQPKGAANTAQTRFVAGESQILEAEGMMVNVPASSFVTEDGYEYNGAVQADMFYLSPENENFTELMPGGDLAAVRTDESDVQLISYGMVEVSLQDDNGNKLQLKEGESSEMTFPIPESMRDNPPAEIPLWYFDDNSGLWVEEGIATLVGDVYVGEVNHYSWHNLDYPAERVTVSGRVTDCQGRPVSRVQVTVEQTSAVTRQDGTWSVYVPENTPVMVKIESEDYFNYTPEAFVEVPGYPGGSVVRDVDLELPCVPVISGRVVNRNGGIVVASIRVEYNGRNLSSDVAYTNSSTGEFSLRMPLDALGAAVLVVEPLGGETIERELNLEGTDISDITIEIEQNVEEGNNVILIKDRSGNPIATSVLDATSITTIANGSFAHYSTVLNSTEGMFVVGCEVYDGTSSSFDGVTVAYTATFADGSFHIFSCENAHVDIASRSENSISFIVTAEGEFMDYSNYETIEATLVANITTNLSLSTDGMLSDVTDWSSLQCATVIPELLTPIDLVANMNVMGMELECLFYRDATMEDAQEMADVLREAGWSVMDEQTSEGSYVVSFMDDSFRMVGITFEASGQEGPDGNSYTLSVVPII